MKAKLFSPLALALLGLATAHADDADKAVSGADLGAAIGGGGGYLYGKSGEADKAEEGAAAGAVIGALIGGQAEEADAPDNLHDTMEVMGRSLKALRKLEENDWDGGAALVLKARNAAYLAINMIPDEVLEIPDAAIKAREIANYQRLSGLAYSNLCELELAYRAQDQAAIDAAKKKVFATKKEGHDKYEKDDH